MKRNMQEKGITLIALVVTIVVLLILAGTSIAMLTGENGLIKKAQDANVETRGAAVQEAKELWKSSKMLDKEFSTQTAQTLDELLDDLEEQNLITPKEKTDIKNNGEVTIGTRTIDFSDKIEFYLMVNGWNGAENLKYTVTEGTTIEQFILSTNPEYDVGPLFYIQDNSVGVITGEEYEYFYSDYKDCIGAVCVAAGGPVWMSMNPEWLENSGPEDELDFVFPQDEIIEGAYYNCIR